MEDPNTIAKSENSRLALAFSVVIVGYLISGLYASIWCRGLFQDGAYYLMRVAERDWFYLHDPNRLIVHVIRQAPVVLMLQFGDFSLISLAQVFSAAMLLTPPLIIGLCWLIPDSERRSWAIVPVINLLVGFSTMSFEAVGEAAIAVSYFWLLLFMLLFRARTMISQLVFLVLCLPAFQMHEGICLLMPTLFLGIALRFIHAKRGERIFLGCVCVMLVAILAYQLRWMIYPRIPGEREGALWGMLSLGFIYFDGHFNLPVLIALAAIAALTVVLMVPSVQVRTRAVVIFWLLAFVAVLIALLVPESLSPAAQSLSRYNPLFAAIVLGIFTTIGAHWQIRIPLTSVLPIVMALFVAQTAADIAATARWKRYVSELADCVSNSKGLVDWRGSQPAERESDWRLMTVGWVHPIMSIIFAKDGQVKSIFNYPPQTAFKPIDLSDPSKLPKIRGVSYQNYHNL